MTNMDKLPDSSIVRPATDDSQPGTASSVKGKGGMLHVISATRYSFLGISAAWKHEMAFRQEMIIGAICLALVPVLAPSFLFGVVMCISILFVLCVELINSAIEALADAISAEWHPLLGRAKDLGSAAVFFSLLIAAVVWGAAFLTWMRS